MKNEREKSDPSKVAKRPANKPKVSEVDLWAAGRSRRSQGKGQSLRKQGADLTGGLWALRGNEWTRSQEQLDLRRKLGRAYPILGRAIALREALQRGVADGDLLSIRW